MPTTAPSGAQRGLWIDLGIVASIGIIARVMCLGLAPGALTFPDTFTYVTALFAPGSPAHPSDLASVWWAGTFGTYSVASVAALQMVLGLFSGVALADGLRRIAPRWIALGCAIVYTCFPPLLGFERVFLTEPLCADLGAVGLWMLIRLATTTSPRAQWGWAGGLAVSMGLMVVIRSALLIAALSVIAVMMVLLLRSTPRVWWRRASLVTFALLIFAAPLAERSARNHAAFGTWSLAPASTAYLFARWAPLIPCPTAHQDLTAAARRDMEHACTVTTYGAKPGAISDMMWGGPKSRYPNLTRLQTPAQRVTQHQLAAVVNSALLHHPVAVAKQVAASLWYQAFGKPDSDLSAYRSAVQRTPTSIILAKHHHGSRDEVEFFRGRIGDPNDRPPLLGLLAATMRWPQFLLWVTLGLGATVTALGAVLRRRPSLAWLSSARVLVGLTCVGFCIGEMLNIAVGSLPIFRYLFPLVPWFIGLVALEGGALVNLAGRTRTGDSGRARSAHGA